MLCLCLYVPLIGEAQTEFQYFESKGLPSELKSIFKLSVFIPSQEFSTFRQWKQVCTGAVPGQERQQAFRQCWLSEWMSGGSGDTCEMGEFLAWLSCGDSQRKGYFMGMTVFHVTSKEGLNYREGTCGRNGREFFCWRQEGES